MPTFSYLTDIHFGCGVISRVGEICNDLGINNPLLVTDKGLADLGFPSRLPLVPRAVFEGVSANPTEEDVLAGHRVYRENQCDGIIALGGGSPIDCAKAIALLVSHPEPLEQYAVIKDGLSRITGDQPPIIAVPTTAGTGSEVGRAALIAFPDGDKLGIISKHLIPTAAICDPELTRDLSPRLTAATGMDAISHCVETYCSPVFNPVADAIALDGLARAWRHLPMVMEDPGNLDYRSEMMMAATQGALAFQKGLGMVHSLSHPLGGIRDKTLHHGALNAVFLSHVIRYNADACPEKIKYIAGNMGVNNNGESVAHAFDELIERLGLPRSLSKMGVNKSDLKGIPEAAMKDHSTPSNPRKMDLEGCRQVLGSAFGS